MFCLAAGAKYSFFQVPTHGLLVADFNSEISNKYLKAFCEFENLKLLAKNPICFKIHVNPDSQKPARSFQSS